MDLSVQRRCVNENANNNSRRPRKTYFMTLASSMDNWVMGDKKILKTFSGANALEYCGFRAWMPSMTRIPPSGI